MPRKKNEEVGEAIDATSGASDTPAAAKVDAAATTGEDRPKRERKAASKTNSSETGPAGNGTKTGKRAEKVGIVSSDKMTKTVVVRVDRVVKHPVYRKYVKKRKKFMAHDELGAKIGDKVKIVETRPLSARKRWRVVEIIQKAEL